jgi:hypothetical protein
MLLKREAPEDAYDADPQNPHDMVRAILPKPQPPAMKEYISRPQRLMSGPSR